MLLSSSHRGERLLSFGYLNKGKAMLIVSKSQIKPGSISVFIAKVFSSFFGVKA